MSQEICPMCEGTKTDSVNSIDWLAGDVVEMTGTSYTTGGKQTFTFNEKQWSQLLTHYPAWNFDLSTKRIIKAS